MSNEESLRGTLRTGRSMEERGADGTDDRDRTRSGMLVEVEVDDRWIVDDWSLDDAGAVSVSLVPQIPIRDDLCSLLRVSGSVASIREFYRRMEASKYVVFVTSVAKQELRDASDDDIVESVFEVTWSDKLKKHITPVLSCGAHVLDARSDHDTTAWSMRFLLRDSSQLTDLMDAMTAKRIPLTIRSVSTF